jgi:ubiquinone/menaquinone biosynthesis C-methylase UbiE
MNSFVLENLTVELFKKNGITIETSLALFIQDQLSLRYPFVYYDGKKKILTSFTKEDFCKFLYVCNCLLNVECLTFDHECINVYEGEKIEFYVPMTNGTSFSTNENIIGIDFIKCPGFMSNYIVHPLVFDSKKLYLKGIYMKLLHSTDDIDEILPFGEAIKDLFISSVREKIDFNKVLDMLILSQLPTFEEYITFIEGTYSRYHKYQPTKTLIRISDSPKSDVQYKSQVYNIFNSNYSHRGELTDYEKRLLTVYNTKLEEGLNMIKDINSVPYAYPILKKVYFGDDTFNNIGRLMYNFEMFLLCCNDVDDYSSKINFREHIKKENGIKISLLKEVYPIKKAFVDTLRKYYFSYHLSINSSFGRLYKLNDIPYIPIKINELERVNVTDKIYYPTWTLNQFNNIVDKEILVRLIGKTVWHNDRIYKSIENNIRSLLSKGENDITIFRQIRYLYNKYKPRDTGFDKGEFRYKELKKLNIFKGINRDAKYLDFGGGVGDVSAGIARNEGYKKENCFVTDIQNWMGKENVDDNSKYITYRYLKTNIIPFEDNTFNLITCLQVLHHIPEKMHTIKELKRVLSKDGILVVREHNSTSVEDRTLIDLEHSLHAYAVDQQGEDYLQNYHDNYMSGLELEQMMKSVGFIEVNLDYPPEKGITKYYYSVWRKGVIEEIKEEKEISTLSLSPSKNNIKKFNNAFVWLLMKGDSYLPGVYTSIHSVNRTKVCGRGSDFNTVVMVTPDVSDNAIATLNKVCDYVVKIDYIKHPTKPMKTERQKEIYGSWIDVSYTKWSCLLLPFNKVVFLDADVIVLDTISSLFELNTPAGQFSSAFAKPSGKLTNYYVDVHNVGSDGYAKHGSFIDRNMIQKGMETTTVHASSIVLSPSVEDFKGYMKMLSEFKVFGFDTNSGADEQSIVYYYSLYSNGPNKTWVNVHQRFNFHSFKQNGLFLKDEMPYVIHFMSTPKVWMMNVNEYEDLVNWYIMFLDGINEDGLKFFLNVQKNIGVSSLNLLKLKEVCLKMNQKYIKSFTKKINVNSCLDVLCKLDLTHKISWADMDDEELEE